MSRGAGTTASPRRFVRSAGMRVLSSAAVIATLERLPAWRGVLVLNYHRIGDPGSSFLDRELFSATPAEFERQVTHLARCFDIAAIRDIPEILARGTRGRHVALTFDDGYRDNHTHALPVLRRHGVQATFFLATGFIDRPRLAWWDEIALIMRSAGAGETAISAELGRYKSLPEDEAAAMLDGLRAGAAGVDGEASELWITWDMARELRDAGMGIGGHTVDHPVLSRISDERLEQELGGCAGRLRDELGVTMDTFAYPVGLPDSYDSRAVELLRAAGVSVACTFSGGFARPGFSDLLELPRAGVRADMALSAVRLRAALPQRFARW